MKELSLCIMTRELCHELFNGWENDPAIYMDMDLFAQYKNDENTVNRYFESKQTWGKCGNPLCISHFSHCTIGAKDSLSSRRRFIQSFLKPKGVTKAVTPQSVEKASQSSPPQRRIKSNHFPPRHVRGGKYISGCVCASCAP